MTMVQGPARWSVEHGHFKWSQRLPPREDAGSMRSRSPPPLEGHRCLRTPLTVINLSPSNLFTPDESLLSKGLSFCPSLAAADWLSMPQLSLDFNAIFRRICLHDYFFSHFRDQERLTLKDTNLHRLLQLSCRPPKSSITPPLGAFRNSFHSGVR